MRIQKAVIKDADEILDLISKEPFLTGNPSQPDDTWYDLDDVKANIYDGNLYVCTSNGDIVGALLITRYPTFLYSEFVVVKKDQRNKGVYNYISEFREDLCRELGLKYISCEVSKDNTFMQEILHKKGWNRGGEFIYYSKEVK